MAMTSTTRNIVGIHKIHHSPDRRYCIPIRINVPSDRESAGSPTPRKDSVASSRIDVAALIVGAKQEPGGTALCPDRRQQTVDQRERAKIIRIRRRDPRRQVAPATIVTLTTTARIASGLRENSQTFVYTRVSLIG